MVVRETWRLSPVEFCASIAIFVPRIIDILTLLSKQCQVSADLYFLGCESKVFYSQTLFDFY